MPGVAIDRGDHVVALHLGPDEGRDLLVSYLRTGLRSGGRCVAVVPPADVSAVRAELPRGVDDQRIVLAGSPDVDQLQGSQSVGDLIGAAAGADPDAGPEAPQASSCIVADVAWVASQLPGRRDLLAYESELHGLVDDSADVALCLCDLERVELGVVMDLLGCHGQVQLGPRLFANPYYLPRSLREQLSSGPASGFEGLLAISMLMAASDDLHQVADLAATAVASLGSARLLGLYAAGHGWLALSGPCRDRGVREVVRARLGALGVAGGLVPIPHVGWSWAFPLRDLKGRLGCILVGAEAAPPIREHRYLQAVAERAAAALSGVRLRQRQRDLSRDLKQLNAALADTSALLEWSTTARERLSQGAVEGDGLRGIAEALREVTGCPVAVEDEHGRLQVWVGPDQPDPYPETSAARRQEILSRLRRAQQPIWDEGRLVTTAECAGELVGMVMLVDPEAETGEGEMVALADAATLLALELGHRRDLARMETRLGRDLLRDLLDGTGDETVLTRVQALGYEVGRPYRVVAVEPWAVEASPPDAFFHAVRRAARDTGIGTLLVAVDRAVVVLSAADGPDGTTRWEGLRAAILAEPGGGRCRIGIGNVSSHPAELPHSLRQARLALRLQDIFSRADQVTVFDELGIFQMLASVAETTDIESYVDDWLAPLAPLLDYDASNGSDLVATLSHYLEHGGRYVATAQALAVHRSTLKYRLQRIKEISGVDLTDADTLFNLQLATRAWRTLTAIRRPSGHLRSRG